MSFPLFILSILSIFVGFLTKDLFIGFGTNFWGSSIFILPQNYMLYEIEFIDINKEVFEKEQNPRKLFPFEMFGHYSEVGYRKVATSIYNLTK